ncbi:diacylglycerol O-acyltransferase 3-like [Miscanthus floridulus]|uniref:diacylglycerol O-acyltransferase 3-like n=1 Tax=Miscanthus floridulus TaxID=154761 RepID=UPI00345758E0
MELTGAALRLSVLPSESPVAARAGRRRRPTRVACVGGAGFAEEGHLRYYEAAPRRKAVEVVARDLGKLRAMGLVAGDAAKEKVLSEATDLLLQELSQMKDEEYKIKKVDKEEKAAMKALKKQEKGAKKSAITMMKCEEDESSSESSESDCEDEANMNVDQGMMISTAVPEVVASSIAAVSAMECDKAAMKAMKKMEKEQMKATKKMEKEQKKAAKKAMKMEKEAKKMAMAALNGCRDEDDSSCSSESSESECEGQVVRMSRCATITAPEMPSPSTGLPIIVPQIPAPLSPEPSQPSELATVVQATRVSSVAVAETSTTSRIEVCMGGKCKKSGALALLQEFEKAVGTEGAVVGCKCLGKCGLGPNVRLRSDVSAEGSAKGSPLCIGVGFEDVGTIVAGLFGDADLGMTPT